MSDTDLPTSVPVGTRVQDLDTPSVLIDLVRLQSNIGDWQTWMDARGVAFRPHIKTHKVPEVARMQLDAGARGIVCAKLSEAEPFVAAGATDVAIAFPVVGAKKWAHAADLVSRGVRLTVNCDSHLAVEQASAAASRVGLPILLQIDIDTGMHRGGIDRDSLDAVASLSRAIVAAPHVIFDGITTHRAYFMPDKGTPQDEGHIEGETIVALAQSLRERGIDVPNVTCGGSFTGKYCAEVPGVTEVRAGTYVFYDLMHINEGTASLSQLAQTVLCTVVSRWGDGRVTIDGGSKTFSGDRGVVAAGGTTPVMAQSSDGRVAIDRMTEEHAMGQAHDSVAVGDELAFYPFHACTCSNLANEMYAVADGQVQAVWPVAARGLRQ